MKLLQTSKCKNIVVSPRSTVRAAHCKVHSRVQHCKVSEVRHCK